MSTRKCIFTALAVFSLFVSSSANAGVLSLHPNAFNDGNGPNGGAWSGSLGYNVSGSLTGQIDFAVFTASTFNSLFGGLGYLPGDQLVYTYQVVNTGTSFVSAQLVGISNPANTIGTFNIGDVNAVNGTGPGEFDGSGNADWQFSPSLATNQSSFGLAFSSPNVPHSGLGLTLNGGLSAFTSGLPTPSATPIPEPTSVTIVAGLVALVAGLRSRGLRS